MVSVVRVIAGIREALRRHRHSERRAVRLAIGIASGLYRGMLAPFRFCLDPSYRSILFLRFLRRGDLHQSTVQTRMDRYPEIFSVCHDYFAAKADLRILSYGCATGEEVLTLRRYFPSAFITGAELNRGCLAVARKHRVDDRILFLEPDPGAILQRGPFDAIFCMAVLQRTPMRVAAAGIGSLKSIYPFEKFDRKVTELDSWLKKDGLLVVHHSQYSLMDAAVGSKFVPLETAKNIFSPGPRFDRRSVRCDVPANSVFVKVRD